MDLICILLLLFELAFLLRIVLSFFPLAVGSAVGSIRDVTVAVTDPVVLPLRRALPPLPGMAAGFGLAEILILIGLQVLVRIFCSF